MFFSAKTCSIASNDLIRFKTLKQQETDGTGTCTFQPIKDEHANEQRRSCFHLCALEHCPPSADGGRYALAVNPSPATARKFLSSWFYQLHHHHHQTCCLTITPVINGRASPCLDPRLTRGSSAASPLLPVACAQLHLLPHPLTLLHTEGAVQEKSDLYRKTAKRLPPSQLTFFRGRWTGGGT